MPPRKTADSTKAPSVNELLVKTLTSPFESSEFEVRTNRGNRTFFGTYIIEGGTLYVKPDEGQRVTLSPSGWTEIVDR